MKDMTNFDFDNISCSYHDPTDTDKLNPITNVPKVIEDNNLLEAGNILHSFKKKFLNK